MRAKVIEAGVEGIGRSARTFALVFATGEEVMAALTAFAQERSMTAGHFTAIGALSDVTLGFFDWQDKRYREIPLREQLEVLSLVGDIALQDGKPAVHAHIVVSKADGTAHGGRLLRAYVRPTLEVILLEAPNDLRRKVDLESGLALIDLGA
jgi:predicted DNA-binding protein with PD1-like motif